MSTEAYSFEILKYHANQTIFGLKPQTSLRGDRKTNGHFLEGRNAAN
jgi:hypothetical protein